MGRLPFDASRAAGAARDRADQPLSVSQLAGRIDLALKSAVPTGLRVVGEVSGFRDRTHWYFDLKDADAVVGCVMFQSAAKRVGWVPRNGQQVLVRGRVEFYAPGGKVSFMVDRIEPVGAGALEAAFRALCDELRALGWFLPERKRPLPTFPRRIAVITSRTGAALQDVLVTMKRRCPAVGVLVVDVRVQGADAAPEVADAVRYVGANAASLGIDAILLTRGGGSMEDLWAFNERIVAEAIVSSPVPVIAAIGHETDTTIAELVADERGATPTQAAVRLTPDKDALLRQVESTRQRLALLLTRRAQMDAQRLAGLMRLPALASARRPIERARERTVRAERAMDAAVRRTLLEGASRLESARGRIERQRPTLVFARLLHRLTSAEARLHGAAARMVQASQPGPIEARLSRAIDARLAAAGARLEAVGRHVMAVGPQRVLERGFTYTQREDGSLVRRTADVSTGSVLVTHVSDGSIRSVVGQPPDARPAPRKSAKPVADRAGGEPGLFR